MSSLICARGFSSSSFTMDAAGMIADLRVHGAQHRVGIHHDFVRRQRQERAAAHRVVRHEHRDLALTLDERVRDLLGRKHEPARRVQDQIDRLFRWCRPDRPQDRFGVFDVDRGRDRYAEDADRFLAMDHRDDAGVALLLKVIQRGRARGGQPFRTAGC